jgi:hypothetical protein
MERRNWNQGDSQQRERGQGGLSVPESGGPRSKGQDLRDQLRELPVVDEADVPDGEDTATPEPLEAMLSRILELRGRLTSAMMVEAVNCFLVGRDESNFGYKITWEIYRVGDDAYVLVEQRETKL